MIGNPSGAGRPAASQLAQVNLAQVNLAQVNLAQVNLAQVNLAQVNLALPVAPVDDARLADFIAGLEPVNALAEASRGFVWRLAAGDGDVVQGFTDDRVLVNLSVWESLESLLDFAFGTEHVAYMRRRREWFIPMAEAYTVLWWVPTGHRPSVAEAEERLTHLQRNGPTPYAFTVRRAFAPDAGRWQLLEAPRHQPCPA